MDQSGIVPMVNTMPVHTRSRKRLLLKNVLQWLLEQMFVDNTSAAGAASIVTNKNQNETALHQKRNRSSSSVWFQNKLFRFCFSKTCLVDGFNFYSFRLCWRRIHIKKASRSCFQILDKLKSLQNGHNTTMVNVVGWNINYSPMGWLGPCSLQPFEGGKEHRDSLSV